jgi:hypothetical protein
MKIPNRHVVHYGRLRRLILNTFQVSVQGTCESQGQITEGPPAIWAGIRPRLPSVLTFVTLLFQQSYFSSNARNNSDLDLQ